MSAPAVHSQTPEPRAFLQARHTSKSFLTSSYDNCTYALVLIKLAKGIIQLLEE
jgi:hypothetical protein